MIGTREMGSTRLLIRLFVHLPFPARFFNRFNCFSSVYDEHFMLCYKEEF